MCKSNLRARLKKAFRKMWKLGIFAAPNFSCCTTCANAELAEILADDPVIRGYAFWHVQDDMFIKENGSCCIGYGGTEGIKYKKKPPKIITTDKEIAEEIYNFLLDEGFEVKWNHRTNRRLEVFE